MSPLKMSTWITSHWLEILKTPTWQVHALAALSPTVLATVFASLSFALSVTLGDDATLLKQMAEETELKSISSLFKASLFKDWKAKGMEGTDDKSWTEAGIEWTVTVGVTWWPVLVVSKTLFCLNKFKKVVVSLFWVKWNGFPNVVSRKSKAF